MVQNSHACTTYPSAKQSDHILPLHHKLHMLPVSSRIELKIATFTFKVLKFQQPAYIYDLIAPQIPPGSFRSSLKIFLLCLISDQKWVADHFPLLHLPFGILCLNISALQIHYLLSVVYLLISKVSSTIVINRLHNLSSDLDLLTIQ